MSGAERGRFALVFGCLATSAALSAAPPLRTASEVELALRDCGNENRPFEIEADVVYAYRHANCSATVQDSTGQVVIFDGTTSNGTLLVEGTTARIRGRLLMVPDPPRATAAFHAVYEAAERMQATASPNSRERKALPDDPSLGRHTTVTGLLRDVFRDEIDPNFTFLVINDDHADTYAVFSSGEDPLMEIEGLVGFKVSLAGFQPSPSQRPNKLGEGRSRQLSPIVQTHPDSVRPLPGVTADCFSVQDLPPMISVANSSIGRLGRRKIAGFVVTKWSGNNILLRTDDNRLVFATLSNGLSPSRGDRVLVSGVPESAVYYMHLRHSRWKPLPGKTARHDAPAVRVSLRSLFSTDDGRQRYASLHNGTTIRVMGRILGDSPQWGKARQFAIEDSGCVLTVDCCGFMPEILQQIPQGSLVDVTGTCIIRLESTGAVPRIGGVLLALDNPADIRIVKRPPWWTLGKFVVVISILLLFLAGAILWSFMLKRLAERKGSELAREKLSVVESRLKVYERTRLAIELHDLLSQMLSGISMQIGAVRKFIGTNNDKSLRHLDIAAKTLLTCRENLRDCLWDLRSRALDEPDMEAAILETLGPHVQDAAISVRFSVPREKLTDSTAHAILSIIRELVVNALRHGKATAVKVAGCIDGGKVLFSVADNGCGFNPDTAPGAAQGHFGLQGIRERIDRFEGEMSITGKGGHGAKVAIRLNLPKAETRSHDNG